jgi:hypothetical protein
MSSSVSLVTLDAICVLRDRPACRAENRKAAARGSSGTARRGRGSVRRPSVRSHVAVRRGPKRLDTSTQGEYTKSKPAFENLKDFNVSKRQPQILPSDQYLADPQDSHPTVSPTDIAASVFFVRRWSKPPITAWLEVRVLPTPPRGLAQTAGSLRIALRTRRN